MALIARLSIAAFIIVIAVLLALKSRDSEAPRSESQYRHLLWNLKPDDVIELCGQPLKHETVNLCPRCEKPPMLRSLTYRDNNGGNAVLEFSVSKEDEWIWTYLSMRDEASRRKYETYTSQALALPCLVKGR